MLPDRDREVNKDTKTQASITGYTENFVPYSHALFRKTAVDNGVQQIFPKYLA